MDVVKAEAKIDEEGTNKLIDAALDLFSPATESMGLIGDAVRLARVSIATEITKKAKAIADASGFELKAPPTKFLAPFYEKASAEEDVELIEAWSKLLVASGLDYQIRQLAYVDLLARMGPREASTLKELVLSNEHWGRPFESEVSVRNVRNIVINAEKYLTPYVLSEHEGLGTRAPEDLENDVEEFQRLKMLVGGKLLWFTHPLIADIHTGGERYRYPIEANTTQPYYNLQSIGLAKIQTERVAFKPYQSVYCSVCWVEVTALGVDLVRTLELPNAPVAHYGG